MATTIEPRQEALNQLYFEIFKEVESSQSDTKADQATLDDKAEWLTDEAIIARMLGSAKADEIQALLNGDTSAYGGDDSAADQALCNYLAFWTRKNRLQMDRIFRQSKLMRPKWDEKRGQKTYGEMTIDKACEGTSKVYEPPKDEQKLTFEDYNPPLTRERANKIEAVTGIHTYNAIDDPNSISEEELEAFKLPDGPKFECNLPKDHFIQRFIAYGTEISDAYPDYWLAGALYALAVVADKKIKVVMRIGPIYTNLYISINGKSSLARKSTAVDKTGEIILKALPQMLPAMVPTEFSPEAFIEHLSNFQHAPWIRDEAAGVLSLMKKDYMRGFKDSLMSLYDCKPFHRKLRTSQRKGSQTDFNVADPYLNLFWATTGASLGANTDQTDTLSGFLARFAFFFPQGMKPRFMPLEEGTAAISMFEDAIISHLRDIATKMNELPERVALHISPDAAAYYNRWQETREREWIATDDGTAMQIFSRLNPMVIKLGMLFELGAADFDISKPIRLEFIEEACRLVDEYLMPTARAVYDLVGANADKNDIDKIVTFLKQHNGKGSKREIMRYVKIKRKDFDDYVSMMVESEMVDEKIVENKGKGRNTTYLLLRDNSKVTNVSKVPIVPKVTSVTKIPSSEDTGNSCDTGDVGDISDIADIGDNAQDTGESTKIKVECAVCGKDISNKTQLTKNGKTYCKDCADILEPKKDCGSCPVAVSGDKSAIQCNPCVFLGGVAT